MRYKYEPYTCVRCGYATNDKSRMRRHLYTSSKSCPTIVNDIVMSDEIKDHIINYRIYHIKKESTQTTSIINNTFHQINNMVYGIEAIDKLNTLINYKQMDVIDLDDHIENKFSSNIRFLEHDPHNANTLELNMHDLYEIVDKVSDNCTGNIEEFNILYDEKINKLALFESGTWEKLLYKNGIVKLITTIQNVYLNAYEKYLIRKVEDSNNLSYQERAKFDELLIEYYKFLVAFGIKPFVINKDDSDILPGRTRRSYDIQEKFCNKYSKVKEQMKQGEITKVGKEILDILKRNSKRNVEELNKKMMSLLNMDEEFKKTVLQLVQPNGPNNQM